jgi:ribosomal protein S18 acetylase RimI-like enzyme
MSEAVEALRGTIEPAVWPDEVPLARELFLEYADWLDIDLCFQGFDEELAGLPGGYAPPDGNLWFARVDGAVAGVVGLRPFGSPDRSSGRARRWCEMKRLWVRPDYRGLGLGRRLAEQALRAAEVLNYRGMCLDTLHRMTAAQVLYARLGFRDRTDQVRDPHPELIYMERDLGPGTAQGPG